QPNPHVLRGEVTMALCERWGRAPIPSRRGLGARQKALRMAQLRVGLHLLFASISLAVVTFLISCKTGLFTPKIRLKSYFDDAQGIRNGAPVRLAGVDIGNVTAVRIVTTKPGTPVEVVMKVTTKYHQSIRKDSVTSMATAGVLGETYIN